MARLPQPGGDSGNWGVILNDYLSQSHDTGGVLKAGSVGMNQLQDDAVTASKIDSAGLDVKVADLMSISGSTRAAMDASYATVEQGQKADNAVTLSGTPVGNIPTVKLPGDSRASVWEFAHNDTTGYLFHLLAGSSMSHTAALIGLGVDNDGIGIMIPNKKLGRGIVGDQRATITDASAYWMHVTQRSSLAPAVRLEMQANDAAPVMQLISFGSPGTEQRLLYVGDPNGEAGSIMASDGKLSWRRGANFYDRNASVPTYITLSDNTGVPDADRTYTRVSKNAIEFLNTSGTAGLKWPFRIYGQGSNLRIQSGAASAVDSATYSDIMTLRNGQISFFGATPIARRGRIGALTDSSGGVSSSTTISPVTDTASAANAIATLAVKVNALEALLSSAAGGYGLTA